MDYPSHNYNYNYNSQSSSNNSQQTQSSPPTTTTTTSSQNTQQNPTLKNGFINALYTFFNYKTGTILAFSVGICIGGAFKDLIQNLVTSIIQPLLIKLLIITKIYDITAISSVLKEEHTLLSLTSAASAIISFLIIVITVFLVFMGITATPIY
jgi:large-conductance mechanosensitive channel